MRILGVRHSALQQSYVRILIIFCLLPFIHQACSNSRYASSHSEEVTHSIAKNVVEDTVNSRPDKLTSQFSPKDGKAVSFIKLHNIKGSHQIRWDWITPSGELYATSNDFLLRTRPGYERDHITAWHTLSIKDQPAATLPGKWKVMVYLDDKPLDTQIFTISPAKCPGVRGVGWAVIIGISSYQDTRISRLHYADKDAQALYEWIISPKGGKYAPERVKLLINERATGRNIKYLLNDWLKKALKEDKVTVYFAGHGSSESPESQGNYYLLPYDTEYDRISSTAFPMWDIETALRRYIRARKVIVLADACHSGGVGQSFDMARRAGRGVLLNNRISSALEGLSKVGDGICVISASDTNQFSQESERWGGGHGVFTYFLQKGLQGDADYNADGEVNLGELTPYLSQNVRRETENQQSPIVSGKFDPALTIGQ
ncbi:peptidase C14, caspase domain protein [Desulfosarcina variabilis str. Montpellier]|uniref:caspase family protein n=1 Tax=Desulfosarcina variabilis TaxID=2300 RepID=UPI003AFAFB39